MEIAKKETIDLVCNDGDFLTVLYKINSMLIAPVDSHDDGSVPAVRTGNAYQAMRAYYDSGATRSEDFRRRQLRILKAALQRYDSRINEALYADLRKSPELAYLTETGLVISEINLALKNLHRWMAPERKSTNWINFPSASKLYKDPLGLVLIIAPWNYPLQLLLLPLVGAIAAGNCVVLKPSELAPATAGLLERLITELFTPEYIRICLGEGSVVVPDLMERFQFDHVFYTGSPGVGQMVYQMAAAKLIPVTLELGGKSPVVVEADANLDVAARRICFGKFINAGQTCIAPDYILAHESVKDELIEKIKAAVSSFFGKDPAASPDFGKIISPKRFHTLTAFLKEGRIRSGGTSDLASLYIEPTIIDEVSVNNSIMKEEVFGPLLPVMSFSDRESAWQTIRKNPHPLSFYLFTSSATSEKCWISQLAFGNGCINNTVQQFTNPNAPFGGIGMSGMGAYHGRYSFQVFSHSKPVMKTPVWPDPSFRYPPFRNKFKWLKLLFK